MRFRIGPELLRLLREHRERTKLERADRKPPVTFSEGIKSVRDMASAEAAAARFVEGMEASQVEVESAYDAFLIDPGMGPMTYLTTDGRVLLDMRTWSGEGIREANDDEAIASLVVGARKTGISALLDLLPSRPPSASACTRCRGSRWAPIHPSMELTIVCQDCGGRGWIASS